MIKTTYRGLKKITVSQIYGVYYEYPSAVLNQACTEPVPLLGTYLILLIQWLLRVTHLAELFSAAIACPCYTTTYRNNCS